MNSIKWEEYLTKSVTTFREEFGKLGHRQQQEIREGAFRFTLLEPCQIEVLDFGTKNGVLILPIHDNQLPDMTFKVHRNVKDLDTSEFLKKYYPDLEKMPMDLLSRDSFVIMLEKDFSVFLGRPSPSVLAGVFLRDSSKHAVEHFKNRQVSLIKTTTDGLKKDIARIPEKGTRDELLIHADKIEGALREIKRVDEDVSRVRQLVGATKEIQDWRLLVSDVDRLKEEHVPREVFEARIDELTTRINSFSQIKEAYDKVLAQQNDFMKQQADVMKQQASFVTWIKYATVLLPVAVVLVPIIDALIRHFIGTA
jgi:hypothetical protein